MKATRVSLISYNSLSFTAVILVNKDNVIDENAEHDGHYIDHDGPTAYAKNALAYDMHETAFAETTVCRRRFFWLLVKFLFRIIFCSRYWSRLIFLH